MARKFEKISWEQFQKDISSDLELYQTFSLPKRGTKDSAGYDFFSLEDFTLLPGEIRTIPLGLKVCMNPGEVLLLVVRSSQGYRYNVRLCNQLGVIDRDFYNNKENEGHFSIRLQNQGDQEYVVKKGDKICQGIFISYLTVDDEEDIEISRRGGLGSTDRKGE